jgi:hypothetical protein
MPVRKHGLVGEGELRAELGSAFAGTTLTRTEGKLVLVGLGPETVGACTRALAGAQS